jgi:Uma2 family endonuclease
MNKIDRIDQFGEPLPPGTTQGAQAWPRLAWTMQMFDRATELGLFGEHDHIEMIHGELVPKAEDEYLLSPDGGKLVAAKGIRHERVRNSVLNWFFELRPAGVRISVEPGWRVDESTYIEPDFILYPEDRDVVLIAPAEVLLAIEVAHSTLRHDLGPRSALLASLGVRNYWVIDAAALVVHTFDEPVEDRYMRTAQYGSADVVHPRLVPTLALRLADFGLNPED